GTGGLTRLTDKRRVRRDHADIFCTTPDGVKGTRAKEWGRVDETVGTQEFADFVGKRAAALASQSDRRSDATGITLMPLERTIDESGIHYRYVDVVFDRAARTATITVRGPGSGIRDPGSVDAALEQGAAWWPLQMARELDDGILSLRTNELELGLWIFRTLGDPEAVAAIDRFVLEHQHNWFVR